MPTQAFAELSKLSFKKYIGEKIHLTDQNWPFIERVVEYRFVPKQEFLLQQGKVCTHLYFLHGGLLRFFIWKEGEDKTKFFTFAPYLFTSQHSFSAKIPSLENIQALEDCHLLQISYSQLQELYEQVPQWRTFIQKVIQQVQYFTEEILIETQTETAQRRYEKMLLEQPAMVQRIPLKYLASYLGIAPQSLSRIRKKAVPHSRT